MVPDESLKGRRLCVFFDAGPDHGHHPRVTEGRCFVEAQSTSEHGYKYLFFFQFDAFPSEHHQRPSTTLSRCFTKTPRYNLVYRNELTWVFISLDPDPIVLKSPLCSTSCSTD